MLRRRPVGRVGRPGLVGTAARTAVVAGTATAVVGGMQHRQQAKAETAAQAEAYQQMQAEQQMADIAAQQAAAAQAAAPPPAAPAGDDPIAQLQKLADMKAQGLLSDEEFAAAKAKLLG
jgi:hypothetical protein